MNPNHIIKYPALFSKLAFQFTTELLNIRVPLVNPEKGSPTDLNIEKYENQFFNAYLYKRKITRS